MNIIYLSSNMEKYGGALYQQDVINEFKNQANVFLYGQGFHGYDKSDKIEDVINKSKFQSVDLICVGHSWLNDKPFIDVDTHPLIKFNNINIKKFLLLNKEYTNLDQKLKYIQENKFDLVFTHHHDIKKYKEETGINFIFWPFAVNHKLFKDYNLSKKYDLTFSGILRNPTFPDKQSDIRLKVQKKLYYSIGEFRLFKRYEYKKYNFFWQGRAVSVVARYLNRIFHKERKLSQEKYYKHLNKSKICINTLSPMDLIGTRYYEAMSSKCLVFCEKSDIYKGIFNENEHIITFSQDMIDFKSKLLYFLEHDNEREKIINKAYNHVIKNHTWEKRVNDLLSYVKC